MRNRVAAADDRDGRFVGRNGLGNGVGAHGEVRKLEDARRAVPDDGLGGRNHLLDGRDRLGADVEALPIVREVFRAVPLLGFGVGGEVVGQDVIDREQEVDALGLGFGERVFRHSILSSSTRLLPVLTPSARWKV